MGFSPLKLWLLWQGSKERFNVDGTGRFWRGSSSWWGNSDSTLEGVMMRAHGLQNLGMWCSPKLLGFECYHRNWFILFPIDGPWVSFNEVHVRVRSYQCSENCGRCTAPSEPHMARPAHRDPHSTFNVCSSAGDCLYTLKHNTHASQGHDIWGH